MKKLLFGLLLFPSVAVADQFCLYNWSKGSCVNQVLDLSFCDGATEGDIGLGAFTICQDALSYADAFFSCQSSKNSCSNALATVSADRDQCAGAYNKALSDINFLLGQVDSRQNQFNQCVNGYEQETQRADHNYAAWAQQAALVKKLRRKCGKACRSIK
jgi:hypothetical protein